jgi:hypothetical protein
MESSNGSLGWRRLMDYMEGFSADLSDSGGQWITWMEGGGYWITWMKGGGYWITWMEAGRYWITWKEGGGH